MQGTEPYVNDTNFRPSVVPGCVGEEGVCTIHVCRAGLSGANSRPAQGVDSI